MRALLVGLFALCLVTQAAVAAMEGENAQASHKANAVHRALTLDERLERKLVALRKHRGTVRFFENNRSLLASGDAPARTKSLAHARTRVRALTRTVAALRAKIRVRERRALAKLPPRRAICDVFGSYCRQALAVAWCESRLQTTAENGQYRGLFQMGAYERSLFGHGGSAHAQARAAHRYFVRSGRDWSPWGCGWAAY